MAVIAVVDYDVGNLHSACKGLEQVGGRPFLATTTADLTRADGIVLPGVGAFDAAMAELQGRGLVEPLQQAARSGKPFLGICLGLQLLFEGSDEGQLPGLGLVSGRVEAIPPEPGLTIPHMGWNALHLTQPGLPLWQHLPDPAWVYFVHSFHGVPEDPAWVAATVCHGHQTLTAAIAQDNLMAVQFHPEKSGETGLALLHNFVEAVRAGRPLVAPCPPTP